MKNFNCNSFLAFLRRDYDVELWAIFSHCGDSAMSMAERHFPNLTRVEQEQIGYLIDSLIVLLQKEKGLGESILINALNTRASMRTFLTNVGEHLPADLSHITDEDEQDHITRELMKA